MITINKIKPFKCRAYDPNSKYLGMLNEYEFNDLRIQIKRDKIPGYYMKFNGAKIDILPSGRCSSYPKGLYDLLDDQLMILMGF